MDPHHELQARGGPEHHASPARLFKLPAEAPGPAQELPTPDPFRTRLTELEQKIAASMASIEALAIARTKTEATLSRLDHAARAAEQKAQEFESLTAKGTKLQSALETLKAELDFSAATATKDRAKAMEDLLALKALLADEVRDAENRLKQAAEQDAQERAAKWTDLEVRLKASSEMAAAASREIAQAKQLAESAKQAGLALSRNELKAVQASVQATVQTTKEELLTHIRAQEAQADLKLSAFLQKQNALLENLNQSIGAVQRTADALRSELAQTKGELGQQKQDQGTKEAELAGRIEKLGKEEAKAREELAAKIYDLTIKVRNTDRDLTLLLTQLKNRSWITGVK